MMNHPYFDGASATYAAFRVSSVAADAIARA